MEWGRNILWNITAMAAAKEYLTKQRKHVLTMCLLLAVDQMNLLMTCSKNIHSQISWEPVTNSGLPEHQASMIYSKETGHWVHSDKIVWQWCSHHGKFKVTQGYKAMADICCCILDTVQIALEKLPCNISIIASMTKHGFGWLQWLAYLKHVKMHTQHYEYLLCK